MNGRYYIRVRGRKNGPLSVEQLRSLARRGRFARHYEVSTDGKTWQPATDFPELFSDGPDDDRGAFADEDLEEPADDPPPRAGKRRKRPSRAPDEDVSAPLPVDFDDLYSADPQSRRQRNPGQRDSGDRESIPLLDDGDEGDPPDEPVPADPPPKRPRRRPRAAKPPRDAVDLHAPLWEPADESAAKPPKTQIQRKTVEPESTEAVESEQEAGPGDGATEKPSGGFFGLFRRKETVAEELEPHLQTLHEMSDRLREETFGYSDVVLVGSRRQELPVVGHHDGGDGIQTLGLLIMIAYQTRSTDIHLEPKIDGYDARMRVDGMLVPIVHIPPDVAGRVAGVIKVLCDIDFSGQLGIQEGSFSATAPGRRTDFRVSFTPSVHGQKLAIRVLDVANSPRSVDGLGAPKPLIAKLQAVMRQNSGMILMCGPTGSGKTTTLYSLIRGIDRKSRNVMTIEDPVEYQIEGVTQSSVDAERGKDFSDMLRALLRQDPDVLLLGEIRDAESARIAMQATMTGHLVLSTVHAQDTVNTVFRLLDLGADPNLVASSLDLVLAQRLVRVLCPHCRKRRRPDNDELQRLGRNPPDRIYEAVGCDRCLGTGYSGRRALFELMETNDRLKEAMLKSPTLRELRAAVQGPGFLTLRQHGHQLVAQGVTTFSEVDRVAGLGH
ncbi:MAG: ATPase, T2SS/T4P/T4SS family [Planctomycetaceae bacterium]